MRALVMKHGWLMFCIIVLTASVALILILIGQIQQATGNKLLALQELEAKPTIQGQEFLSSDDLTSDGLYSASRPDLPESDSVATQTEQEYSVTARTRIDQSVMFNECGHEISSSFSPPTELIGKNKEAVQEVYPDFRVVGFSEEEVSIRRTVDLYCPQHYLLKKLDNEIALYCSTLDGELQFVKTLNISIEHISNELYAELLKGKAYNSLLELEEALEDMGS